MVVGLKRNGYRRNVINHVVNACGKLAVDSEPRAVTEEIQSTVMLDFGYQARADGPSIDFFVSRCAYAVDMITSQVLGSEVGLGTTILQVPIEGEIIVSLG